MVGVTPTPAIPLPVNLMSAASRTLFDSKFGSRSNRPTCAGTLIAPRHLVFLAYGARPVWAGSGQTTPRSL